MSEKTQLPVSPPPYPSEETELLPQIEQAKSEQANPTPKKSHSLCCCCHKHGENTPFCRLRALVRYIKKKISKKRACSGC